MSMYSYEENRDMVTLAAFEKYTNNGAGLDYEEREAVIKHINDVAANSYFDGMTNDEWLDLIMEKLGAE